MSFYQQMHIGAYAEEAYRRVTTVGEPTPYLELRARLSQVVVNRYTLFVLILLVKVILFKNSLEWSLDMINTSALTGCRLAQSVSDSVTSLPRTLSLMGNSLLVTGVECMIQALVALLLMIITGVENLILFAVDLWVGTYACLAVGLIDGAVSATANATEALIVLADKEVSSLASGLESGLQTLSKAFDDVEAFVSDIDSFFTGEQNGFKAVNLTIQSMRNLQLPSSIDAKLESLKNSTPTYDTVKSAVESSIRDPFNTIKSDLQKALGGSLTFNKNFLTVPSKSVTNVCSTSSINVVFSEISADISLFMRCVITVLAVLSILAVLPIVYKEVCSWKWTVKCAENPELAHLKQDRIFAIVSSQSHLKARIQSIVVPITGNQLYQALIRWLVDYLLYDPIFACLLLGFCGLIAFGLQYTMLDLIKRRMPELERQAIGIAELPVEMVYSDVALWTKSTNNALNDTEFSINSNLFGWVESATSSVNDSLTIFMDSMSKELNDTFSGTVFLGPVSSVVQCVIGSKIEAVIKGLTWVHNAAHVSLPRLNSSWIMHTSGVNNTNSTILPTNASLLQTQRDASDFSSLVGMSISAFARSLRIELYFSSGLIAIWLIYGICGLVYCARAFQDINQKDLPTVTEETEKTPERDPGPPTYRVEVDETTINAYRAPSFPRFAPSVSTESVYGEMPVTATSACASPVEVKQTNFIPVVKHSVTRKSHYASTFYT